MSFTPTYACNGCGSIKKESNHWIAIRRHGSRPTIHHIIDIRSFGDSTVDDEHYCGVQCALKAIAAFLDDLRKEQDSVERETLVDKEIG